MQTRIENLWEIYLPYHYQTRYFVYYQNYFQIYAKALWRTLVCCKNGSKVLQRNFVTLDSNIHEWITSSWLEILIQTLTKIKKKKIYFRIYSKPWIKVVSWRSHKQSVLVDSMTKVKHVEATEATKETVWLRKILEYLHEKQMNYNHLLIDNTFLVKLDNNPKSHG